MSIPEIYEIDSFLKPYKEVLSKPQYVHFSHFVKSLPVCEIPSVQRFSALHTKSRSSLSRFLSESTWKIEQMKQIYQSELKPYIPSDSFLLIDDTISKRPYAKKVERANYHYDHTSGKNVQGYSIVTSVLRTEESIIPYDIQPYYRKEDCNDLPFKTKNQLAADIISSSKKFNRITTVIFDSWYSNDEVICACKQANKHYITQIKSNRNVTINFKKRFVREHAQMIKEKQWKEMKYNDGKIRFFYTSAFISKIGSVHLIFSQMYNQKDKCWGETHYFISDLLEVSPQEILRMYLVRVGIESFHREAKQNIGLEGYFLRKCRGIERYLFLVMLTYSILALQGLSKKLSIGQACQENKVLLFEQVYNEILQDPDKRWLIFHNLAKAGV